MSRDGKEVIFNSKSQYKHIRMERAFVLLSSEIDKLERLMHDIRGTDPEEQLTEKSPLHLSSFLASGDECIEIYAKRVQDATIKLRKLLF